MEIILFILSEIVYFYYLSILITKFNNSYLAYSCIFLFIFNLLIILPTLIIGFFIKNRKKYFLISTIWAIIISLIILSFRKFSENGLMNFTFHIYSTIFMFAPFYGLFSLSINKLCFPHKKKKQLIILIVSKKLILIIFSAIFSKFSNFENLLIFISIVDFIFNILSPFIDSLLLYYFP